MTPFKYSRFLCYTIPSFGVSATSPRMSLSNISSTSVIAFIIKCRNRDQIKNNIKYNGNTNNTSVIIFFKSKSQKLPAMVLCLGEPPRRFLLLLFFIHFCSSFCCCSSFIFVLHFVVVVLHFISRLLCHVTGTPPWLLRPVKASTSSELYPGYFRLLYFCQAFPSQFYRERYGF